MKKTFFLFAFSSLVLSGCVTGNVLDKPEEPGFVSNPDGTICTMDYRPVCGKVQVQCITTPCNPVEQTFGNRCQANAAKATDIREGSCEELSGKQYVSESPEKCATIRFVCVEGMEYFADDKGCGCKPAEAKDEPVKEEPKVEEPVKEEPKAEEPKVEEPVKEEPKVEEPKIEEPKVEEVKPETPAPSETTGTVQ